MPKPAQADLGVRLAITADLMNAPVSGLHLVAVAAMTNAFILTYPTARKVRFLEHDDAFRQSLQVLATQYARQCAVRVDESAASTAYPTNGQSPG